MTAVTKWRGPDAIVKHFRVPLPEPPRYRHVSKVGRQYQGAKVGELEQWLRDVALATTIDAD